MRSHRLLSLFITLILCSLASVPARAQLSSYIDDKGNVVFTNPISAAVKSAPAEKARTSVSAAAAATSSAVASSAAPAATSSATAAASKPSSTAPATDSRTTVVEIPATPAPAELDSMVQKTAEKHHVDPNLVRAVISAESNWNADAVSRKGAQGLMQLVPGTAHTLGVGNAFDPAQNVDAGVRYLGMLLERYNGDLNKTLAAYNAGPGVVDRFGGVPNFPETRNYVQKVTSTYYGPGLQPQAPPPPINRTPIYRTVDADGRVVFTNE